MCFVDNKMMIALWHTYLFSSIKVKQPSSCLMIISFKIPLEGNCSGLLISLSSRWCSEVATYFKSHWKRCKLVEISHFHIFNQNSEVRSNVMTQTNKPEWLTIAFFKCVSLQYSKITFLKRKLYLHSLYISQNMLIRASDGMRWCRST